MMTKHLGFAELLAMIERLGLKVWDGRAPLAPNVVEDNSWEMQHGQHLEDQLDFVEDIDLDVLEVKRADIQPVMVCTGHGSQEGILDKVHGGKRGRVCSSVGVHAYLTHQVSPGTSKEEIYGGYFEWLQSGEGASMANSWCNPADGDVGDVSMVGADGLVCWRECSVGYSAERSQGPGVECRESAEVKKRIACRERSLDPGSVCKLSDGGPRDESDSLSFEGACVSLCNSCDVSHIFVWFRMSMTFVQYHPYLRG